MWQTDKTIEESRRISRDPNSLLWAIIVAKGRECDVVLVSIVLRVRIFPPKFVHPEVVG